MSAFEASTGTTAPSVHVLRWLVGPLAATATIVGLWTTWMGLFASGGGLLIVLGVSFWVGWGVAALVDSQHPWRQAFVVAAYLVMVLTGYLGYMQAQPLPPGASGGGANVAP